MNRAQRHRHAVTWLLLAPAIIAMLLAVWAARPTPPAAENTPPTNVPAWPRATP